MREEIKKNNTPKDALINDIIEREWAMFDQVENQGGRAGCQDDEWTFYAMRYSQHQAFSERTLESYRRDLQQAREEGRNLLTEKYAYMMEFTQPDYFDKNLRPHLPSVSPEKGELVDRIANLSIRFQQDFEKVYPAFARAGRPVTGTDGPDVSLHIYTIGELKTYSVNTLISYLEDMRRSEQNGENTAFRIHKSTAEFYGYSSLAAAESQLESRG
ncbi:MAG: DUF4125 family protein [Firmicutes bacterium]|nr:DUF4125 family protein [Bacillota bacterium]